MKQNISKQPQGSELIQRYISALTNLITMEKAKSIAEQKESQFLEQINSLGARNGVYLTSEEIPSNQGETLLKESFNAHLTKVQSEQIINKTEMEVQHLLQTTKQEYVGKKISIEVVNHISNPIDAVYLDKKMNQYRVSEYKVKKLKGTIQDISFDNNLLVIAPTYSAKLLTPNRTLIYVYVVDIQTMNANITIKFI